MLPEFLDEQAQHKPNTGLPTAAEELLSLRFWLQSKETETNRQVRPAWMEIAWALIALVEQRLQDNSHTLEQYVFETHIVARQVARQRKVRQLTTRFVTDEIKRISNHQLDFLTSIKNSTDRIAVIGWYRLASRRGLGLALMPKEAALALSRDASGQENQTEIAEHQQEADFTSKAKKFRNCKLISLLTVALLLVIIFILARQVYSDKNDSAIPSTLVSIQANKKLRCGVDGLLPHFSVRNDMEQTWWGLDVELCKALGVALDVEVDFVKVSASRFKKRIVALENHDVHILFRNTSHTVTRDLMTHIAFGPVYFYEKEYFLDFSTEADETSIELENIKGKNVCVKPGTSNERTLHHLNLDTVFTIVTQDKNGEDLYNNVKVLHALRENEDLCDLVFGNYFVLKQLKTDRERRNPLHVVKIRPFDKAGLDPLAPVILRDYQWQTVVNLSIYALYYADKLGINSYNVDDKYASGNAIEQRFLRGEGMEETGLPGDWVYRILSRVGNYSEIYYRSIVCNYVACNKLTEHEFYEHIKAIESSRWPNKVFNADDPRPGMLYTPKF